MSDCRRVLRNVVERVTIVTENRGFSKRDLEDSKLDEESKD